MKSRTELFFAILGAVVGIAGLICGIYFGIKETQSDDTTTPCTSNPCQNGGTCAVTGNQYTCDCPTGYFGTNCEERTCPDGPCLNGGVCEKFGSQNACSCPTGYSGSNCEVTWCSETLQCNNGGSCSTNGTEYFCECPIGISGTTCDVTPCTNVL